MARTLLSTHWIPTHRGEMGGRTDAQWFRDWAPPFVKIVSVDETIPYLEDVPAGAQIVVRNHPMSENYGNRGFVTGRFVEDRALMASKWPWEGSGRDFRRLPVVPLKEPYTLAATAGVSPEQMGREHAAVCGRMADYAAVRGVPSTRLIFEGLNEPNLWGSEPPDMTARYYFAFLAGLHEQGLRGAAGCFGVGWPGNGGAADAPVQWEFWRPVANAMHDGDYLATHEYWAYNGPGENWRWWAGRFLQCPFDVPILITETGVDLGVLGGDHQYGGWADTMPGESWDYRARRYVEDLLWYEDRCVADGRVHGLFVFTYDIGSSHWERFDIRLQVFMEELTRQVAQRPEIVLPEPGAPEPPEQPDPPATVPEHEIRNQAWNLAGVPYNPDAAFAKYASKEGIGRPVTPEYDVDGYRAQGFDGAILYCVIGDWSNIRELPWS